MTFNVDIDEAARANSDFRRVLSTGPHAQVVVMSIPPGGEIGEEVHAGLTRSSSSSKARASPSSTARRASWGRTTWSMSPPGRATT